MTLDRSRYTIAGGRPPARRDARVPRTGTKNPSFRPHRKPSRRSTSLGYGTPVAVRRGPVRTRPVRAIRQRRTRGDCRATDNTPDTMRCTAHRPLSSGSSPRVTAPMTARFCISALLYLPRTPPPVGPPGASGPRCGPARTCTPALGRSSPRLLAYTVTTVAGSGTARAIHATGFHTRIPLSPPPDF